MRAARDRPPGGGGRPSGASGRGRPPVAAAVLLAAAALACFDPGEPVAEPARVTWVAYPGTVRVDETFTFEMAGPLAPDHCVRLDSVRAAAADSGIHVAAFRSVFPDAMCSDDRRSFYEVGPLRMERPGSYPVRTELGLELGTMVATDTGSFSGVRTIGLGTLRSADGCTLFSPGWSADQRLFALGRLPDHVARAAGSDTVVRVEGTLLGYSLCGAFGSVPTIQVRTARTTGRTAADYYPLERGTERDAGRTERAESEAETDTTRGAP